jgi:hypothetical protein
VRFAPVPAFGDVKGVLTMRGNRIIVASVVLSLLPLASALAGIDPAKFKPSAIDEVLRGPIIRLPCEKSGEHRVKITNSLTSPVPAGTKMGYWYKKFRMTANGGVSEGTVVWITLASSLGPGQTLEAVAGSWDVYYRECSAWFFAGLADLELLQVSASRGIALLKIRNNNHFVSVPQFVVRIRSMKCSQIQLTSVDRSFPTIGPGETQELSVSVLTPVDWQYYDVHIDPNNAIRESNENNNTFTGVGVCIN